MRRSDIYLLLAIWLLSAYPLYSAIALDSTSTSGVGSYVNTLSWNHTIGSGANRVLVVGIYTYYGLNVTGITFNGVAMTASATASRTAACVSTWFLVAPATGTHSITVSYSGYEYTWGGATSFSGVDQTSPINATGTATGYSFNNITNSVTPLVDSCFVLDFLGMTDPASITSVIWTQQFFVRNGSDGTALAGSLAGPISPALIQTNTWVLENTVAWADVALVIAPYAASGSGRRKVIIQR